MTADEMSQWVQDFFARANGVQWKKNKDYHPDNVAFLEILRTCAETGITVEQDLWAKFRKQEIALRKFMIEGKVESEPPAMRRIDVVVYIAMMDFWDANRKQIIADVYRFAEMQTHCESKSYFCNKHMTQMPICDRCMFKFWLEDRAR